MYRLFLDDIRTIRCVDWDVSCVDGKPCKFPVADFEGAVIARNYDEFCAILAHDGVPSHISFDHDLDDIHYADPNCEQDSNEKSGYDCARYLIDYCMDNNVDLPEHIYVHSFNPVGRQRIYDLFMSYKRFIKEI